MAQKTWTNCQKHENIAKKPTKIAKKHFPSERQRDVTCCKNSLDSILACTCTRSFTSLKHASTYYSSFTIQTQKLSTVAHPRNMRVHVTVASQLCNMQVPFKVAAHTRNMGSWNSSFTHQKHASIASACYCTFTHQKHKSTCSSNF